MEIEDIKPIGKVIQTHPDFGTIESEVIQGITMLDVGTKLYTDEQMQDYLSNQPRLTIPKIIADELDKYDFELTSKGLMYRNMGGTLVEFSRVTYDEIPQLIVQTIAGNYRIVFAYLAGKALGVDLVKVGEG